MGAPPLGLAGADVAEMQQAVNVLEGLQRLRAELDKREAYEPYSSDPDGAVRYGEGYESGMENAADKLDSLLRGITAELDKS